MAMEYKISNQGTIFTSELDTPVIKKEILKILEKADSIVLDFAEVSVMTTTAAKSILQPIVDTYGYENLFNKVFFKNVSDNMKIIIGTAVDGLKK